jgi:hypothetical protein
MCVAACGGEGQEMVEKPKRMETQLACEPAVGGTRTGGPLLTTEDISRRRPAEEKRELKAQAAREAAAAEAAAAGGAR